MALISKGWVIKDLVPHVINCTRELYSAGNTTSAEQWMFITNEVMYYLFPIILTVGVIFSIINTIVTAKMTVDSHECYLTAFNFSCSLLLMVTCAIQLPNYVRQSLEEYSMVLPYLPAVESWCWYCCTWLLITVAAERAGHSMCGKWHSSFGRVHGMLVSLLIVVICFVSTLPQYWEYCLEDVGDMHDNHNCTRTVFRPRDGVLHKTDEGHYEYILEYTWFHWYEMIISLALPYLVLPMLLPPLVCVTMHIYTSLPITSNGKVNGNKYTAGSSLKDQLRQERSFNRLVFTVCILYLLMAAPRNVLKLLHNPPISWVISDNQLLVATLTVTFDVLFYLFFSILFFMYLAFGSKFKTTLYQLCCCKKQESVDYY